MGRSEDRKQNSFKHEFIAAAEDYIGRPAIQHHIMSPGCRRFSKTPDRCMEIGLGQDGALDCSGLIISAFSALKAPWPRELRHTRQMYTALKAAGETGKPLAQADEYDIGNVVFSRTIESGHIIHVSVLKGFMDDGQPLIVEAAGSVGHVIERQPPCPRKPLERFVFNTARLAEIATEHVATVEI